MTNLTPWFSVFATKTEERMLGGFQYLTPVRSCRDPGPTPTEAARCVRQRLGLIRAFPARSVASSAQCCVAGHACPSPPMFSVTEAEATAIRDALHQRGELSAVIASYADCSPESATTGRRMPPHDRRLAAV
jgi:hypothetical protein